MDTTDLAPENDEVRVSAGAAGTPAAPAPPSRGPSALRRFSASQFGLVLTYGVVVVFFWVQRPDVFSQMATWQGILNAAALPAIVAMALTVTLIAGDFDLSIGATIGLAMAVTVATMVNWEWGWPMAVGLALLCAIGVGVLNGVLVANLGVNSFIATLAMSSLVQGFDAKVSNQQTISSGLPDGFVNLGSERIAGFSLAFWLALVVGVLLYVLVSHTENGRYLFAVGGNREAARLAGVRVRWLRYVGMISAALGAAVVGALLAAQTASYYPNAGGGYLLPAYAAAFLGTALGGGRFGIVATGFGVVFLQTLQTGLTVINVQPWVVLVVQGAVLAIAVVLSTSQGKLRLPALPRRPRNAAG
ncbi:ABC transporter permease [Nocardioides caldifontis]|uniref:ABC transporter permease n=1 Tax=Nocardioides caldifontis TaxID=2588938 RepID=UPI0011DFF915|nr:ABC transporter permease [Nocardioides caldifontis]